MCWARPAASVPIFARQIDAGGPVTVTDPDMRRYFMTIPEAAQLVMQAGAIGGGGEIFVLDMGQPVRIVELAEQMIRQKGLTVGRDIRIRFTGMRPGEKLFEELANDTDRTAPTSHPKIKVWHLPRLGHDGMRAVVDSLSAEIDAPRARVLAALSRAVPEFAPPPAPTLPLAA